MSRQLLDKLPQSFFDTLSRLGAMLDSVLAAVSPLHSLSVAGVLIVDSLHAAITELDAPCVHSLDALITELEPNETHERSLSDALANHKPSPSLSILFCHAAAQCFHGCRRGYS